MPTGVSRTVVAGLVSLAVIALTPSLATAQDSAAPGASDVPFENPGSESVNAPIQLTEEEAKELGLGCDYVTYPNGEVLKCIDGKPPVPECIGYCFIGIDLDAALAGRFRFEVSNFGLQAQSTAPNIYGRSVISLSVERFPKAWGVETPLAPVVTAGGQTARLLSFDGNTALYEVIWRQAGWVWLEASDYPDNRRILVYVNPSSSRIDPLINVGMNQFLEWGDGLPRLSADTAFWDKNQKDYQLRTGSSNIVTGAMNMPGQFIKGENINDPQVLSRIEQWLAYPTITGRVRFSYLFPNKVITKGSKPKVVATLFTTEAVDVYKPNEGLDGPIAIFPRTELTRPVMFENDPCQIVNVVAEYDGDETYNSTATQFNVEFCPRRR